MKIDMIEKLKKSLSEKRFIHSLGVRDEAVKMAKKFGADEEKAYIAGLCHDCAKGLKINEQIELCKKYGIDLDENLMSCTPVIHAPLGAEAAKREYGISDTEILDAIRKHTTGSKYMTLLDKIIYVADMTEPNRDFDGVEILRRYAEENIDKAYLECLKQSVMFNVKANKFIHPDTLAAYNEMTKNSPYD